MAKKKKKRLQKWTPLRRTHFLKQAALIGGSYEVYINSRYQVSVGRMYGDDGMTVSMWLSIKHLDKRPHIPWRHMQRIKNELCGPEAEGLEIYPAESRLVDSANQYHLWVLPPGTPVLLGYTQRAVMTESQVMIEGSGARQAPFEPHHNADGCVEGGLAGWGPEPEYIEWLIEWESLPDGVTVERVAIADWKSMLADVRQKLPANYVDGVM